MKKSTHSASFYYYFPIAFILLSHCFTINAMACGGMLRLIMQR